MMTLHSVKGESPDSCVHKIFRHPYRERTDYLFEKCLFLLGMNFWRTKQTTNFKFYKTKGALPVYQIMPRTFGFVDDSVTLRALPSVPWISLSVKCLNQQISLFDLTNLFLELYLHKHYVLLASSSSENKKLAKFLTPAFWKRKNHPHDKCHFLLDIDFFVKVITKLTSNFTWRK